MVELENMYPGVKTQCLDAVVFLSSQSRNDNASAEFTEQVRQLLGKLRGRGLLGSVDFCDVSQPDATAGLSTNASVFIFLIDEHYLTAASATQAAFLATRKSVTGKVLLLPVVMQAGLAFEQSSLAFAQPLHAHTGNWMALESLQNSICKLAEQENIASESAPFDARLEGASLIAETVDPLPCHMSAYDDFIEQLIGRLQVMRMHDRKRNLNLFAEAVKTVLGAEMVYCYYRSKNGVLHLYEAESNHAIHGCTAPVVHGVLEDALKSYSHDLNKRSLHLQNFLPQLSPQNGSDIECVVVVNETLPNCGVFVAAKGGFTRFPLTEILSTVINTLHDSLAWARFETFEKLKARVYDALKKNYRFVSDDMYQDRRRIFANQLAQLDIHFEPMFRFDRQSQEVDVFAYEALAREHQGANAAPADIFNTASLWGMGFQSELDSTLLKVSLERYREQIKSSAGGVGNIKPLSLNIYPATLRSVAYRELLYELLSKSAPLRGEHLIMEVSEKTVVSPELQTEARKQLEDYRTVVHQLMQLTGVRFAIDDFGVGNSSLSRLDRLKPDYVKVDRDILSFDTQMASTLIRYLIDSQNQQGASVILEGVDIHSKLSLDELVKDIGVGIIQGHSLSKAVSGFDAAWEHETCERVKRDLGWQSAPIVGESLVLH